MSNGTTSVVQAGQKGEKKITYKVTYDSDGKEISREKKSEKGVGVGLDRIYRIGKHGSRKTTGMSEMQQGDDGS